MAKAPLYTVTNLRQEPRFAMIGIRKEPIDAGRSKDLPISEETALALAADNFKVTRPDGRVIGDDDDAEERSEVQGEELVDAVHDPDRNAVQGEVPDLRSGRRRHH